MMPDDQLSCPECRHWVPGGLRETALLGVCIRGGASEQGLLGADKVANDMDNTSGAASALSRWTAAGKDDGCGDFETFIINATK